MDFYEEEDSNFTCENDPEFLEDEVIMSDYEKSLMSVLDRLEYTIFSKVLDLVTTLGYFRLLAKGESQNFDSQSKADAIMKEINDCVASTLCSPFFREVIFSDYESIESHLHNEQIELHTLIKNECKYICDNISEFDINVYKSGCTTSKFVESFDIYGSIGFKVRSFIENLVFNLEGDIESGRYKK